MTRAIYMHTYIKALLSCSYRGSSSPCKALLADVHTQLVWSESQLQALNQRIHHSQNQHQLHAVLKRAVLHRKKLQQQVNTVAGKSKLLAHLKRVRRISVYRLLRRLRFVHFRSICGSHTRILRTAAARALSELVAKASAHQNWRTCDKL